MNGVARMVRNVKRFFTSAAYRERLRDRWEFVRLNRAIARNPNASGAYMVRALFFSCREMHARAIADFTRVIELDPLNAEALGFRGDELGHRGMLAEAVEDYSRAIALAPGDARYYYGRGFVHNRIWQESGDESAWHRALDDMASGMAAAPASIDLQNIRGLMCLSYAQQTGDREAIKLAVDDFRKTAALTPDKADNLYPLADALLEAGDTDGALSALDAAAKLAGHDGIYALRIRGEVSLRTGKYEAAIAEYDKYVKCILNEHCQPKAAIDLHDVDLNAFPLRGRRLAIDMLSKHYARRAEIWEKMEQQGRAEDDRKRLALIAG